MKTNKIYTALVLLSVINWSCTTQNDVSNASLKSSVNSNAITLTAAVNTITSSTGYQILLNHNTTSSPSHVSETEGVTIDTTVIKYSLVDVAGVWDYKPSLNKKRPLPLNSFFKTPVQVKI